MTNVKVGDVAQVVRAAQHFEWTLGRVVRIAARCACVSHYVYWKFEEPLTAGAQFTQCASDACLKRLDPPTEEQSIEEPKRRKVPVLERA